MHYNKGATNVHLKQISTKENVCNTRAQNTSVVVGAQYFKDYYFQSNYSSEVSNEF